MMRIPIPLSFPIFVQVVTRLSQLPDDAGYAAAREVLKPFWKGEFPPPYEPGVQGDAEADEHHH